MIEYTAGDLLNADVEALVNTVNCVGVMGRGIALQFKKRFPANFKAYASACKREDVRPGRMFVFETGQLTNPKYIINFPTKRHWRGKSRIADIDAGLSALVEEIRCRRIRSIAVPPLGSGLGGLDWQDVRTLIESKLASLEDVQVLVFEPGHNPDLGAVRNLEAPKMTPGRASLVALMHRYYCALLDPYVTLLEVHKLLYFMQEAGEPLRLEFRPAHYGPYAENLRHVLKRIEGHMVEGYADGGDEPEKELRLVPGATEDAEQFLASCPQTRGRLQRVEDLVEGFETPFGLELLSTVHWVVTHGDARSGQEVVDQVHGWSRRKRGFSEEQIRLATTVLADKDWIAGSAWQ